MLQIAISLKKRSGFRDSVVILHRAVYNIVKVSQKKVIDKLRDRILNVAERTVISALETYDVHRNKANVKSATCSALNTLLLPILKDVFTVKKSFEPASVHVATSKTAVQEIAKVVMNDSVPWINLEVCCNGGEEQSLCVRNTIFIHNCSGGPTMRIKVVFERLR